MPMLYLGRSIVANSGGAGKYRGGCSFISTWLINKTRSSAACHLRTFLARVRQCRHVRRLSGADLPEASRGAQAPTSRSCCKKQKPLPHAHRHRSRPLRSRKAGSSGEHVTVEGPYITAPHKAGDIFTHSYNGGGGFGDVLERDPVKTACGCRKRLPDARKRPTRSSASCSRRIADGYPRRRSRGHRRTAAQTMRAKRLKQGHAGVGLDEERARARRARPTSPPKCSNMYASAMKLSPALHQGLQRLLDARSQVSTFKVEDKP